MAEIAANILSHSSCHPLAALGVLVNILLVTQGSAAKRLHPGLSATALRAQNSAGLRPPDFKTSYFPRRHSYLCKLQFGAAIFGTHVLDFRPGFPLGLHLAPAILPATPPLPKNFMKQALLELAKTDKKC